MNSAGLLRIRTHSLVAASFRAAERRRSERRPPAGGREARPRSSYRDGLPFETLFAAREALFGPILVAHAGEHASSAGR